MIDEMPLSTAAFHMQCLLVVVTVTVVAVVLSIGPLIKFGDVRLVWPSRFKWLVPGCAKFLCGARSRGSCSTTVIRRPEPTELSANRTGIRSGWMLVFCCCFQRRGAYQGDGSFAADES
jgi:hypothetical protein